MKKNIISALIILTTVSVTACTSSENQPSESEPTSELSTEAVSQAPEEKSIVLIADFSCGSDNNEMIKQYSVNYSNELTPALIADELSNLTGLNFDTKIDTDGKNIHVSWLNTSSLITGEPPENQKEDFRFLDADTLRWFMMDSLYKSLVQNFGAEAVVFYTAEDGSALVFSELSPENMFSPVIPYMGSKFYFNLYSESDTNKKEDTEEEKKKMEEEKQKEAEKEIYKKAEGVWRFNGADDTAYFEIDENKNYKNYYADGKISFEGHIEFEGDLETGEGKYNLYDANDKFMMYFSFDSDKQFHLGDDATMIYIKK